METYFNYIIESGISLGVFTLVYWLLLRKEVMLKASRIYLLVAVLFSTLLPFFTINLHNTVPAGYTENTAETIVLETNLIETVTVYASGIPAKVGRAIISIKPSVWFYITGATLTLFFIMAGIIQLLSMISKNRSFRLKFARLVVTQKEITPYSFFNFIFINRELPEKENWKAMVHHELEHVKQGHSFDVLFIDFMMVFQWFNPFYWIIRRLVRENHEFLADRAVLRQGAISPGRYKALLLSQAIGGKMLMTSNFFNVKTIQKRFKMITKNRTRKFGLLKYSLGVVAALSITMCFAVSNSAPDENDNVLIKAEIPLKELINLQHTENDHETLAISEVGRNEFKKIQNHDIKNDAVSSVVNADSSIQDEVFNIVEDMPEFPGGELALKKWIANNIKYPETAAEKGIQGNVYVTFVVNRNGGVEESHIARGVDPVLDKEALRIINQLPAWKPGYQRGKAVNVRYTVPINFVLENTSEEQTKIQGKKDDDIFIIVEDMPEFPGGEDSLRQYLANSIKYPKIAAEQGIQGKVYVQFVVSNTGNIKDARIARGVDPALNQEALRVVNSLPAWKPGYQRGIPVNVSYTVPISFQLDNQKTKPKKIDETVVVGYNRNRRYNLANTNINDSIYFECDEMPVFEGGELDVRKYIANNIKYPAEALKYGIQGKVYISFVVAKDGAVERVQIARGVDPSLDNEAIRVVSSMPKWQPGRDKGEPVDVAFTMPVNFQLQ